MVTIYINNEPVELQDDKDVTYTLQVNDIADVATRQTSYTTNFKLPKTVQNTKILKGLGLVGDTSRIPYQKPTVSYVDNGYAVIANGWGVIKNTDKNYNLHIFNGIIDFFKAIENKTLGNDLDLSEINHNKTTQTVVDSFTANLPYCYLVADYNGRTHFDVNNNINIDYLPPSVEMKYLWNKISSTFGFTFVGNVFNTDRFTNWWLTYPKGVAENISTSLIYDRPTGLILNSGLIETPSGNINLGNFFTATDYIAVTFTFFDELQVVIEQPNFYYLIVFLLNGIAVETGATLNLNPGDTISLTVLTFGEGYISGGSAGFQTITKYNTLQNFNEELKDFSITDFIKEVVNEFSLTMFTDNENKTITFLTIEERIETSEIINWSEKYVERTNETYIFDTYAQKNNFKFQYNDKEDNHNDGAITIDNVNIKDSTDVWKSVTYSPEKNLVPFIVNGNEKLVKVFKQYEKEVKESNTGETSVKYKPLQKRYYFQRKETEIVTANFGSEKLLSQIVANTITFANFNQLDMNSVIGLNYLPMQTILNDSRLHTIKLALNIIDIMVLDFKKLYYFEQESMYYLLNKINFKNGDFSTAEFIRVKI